jgi:hypothetical protein
MKSKWLKFPAKMRTLLRKTPTGMYLQGPDRWTNDPSQALDFQAIDRALHFTEMLGLTEVELAFAFDDYRQIKRVPLEKAGLEFMEK